MAGVENTNMSRDKTHPNPDAAFRHAMVRAIIKHRKAAWGQQKAAAELRDVEL